ncbi:MAG: hypothetical protein HQL66_10730 [Magnetococcales bacterium]|nr:hypothetical protein [Magnetococcales bacterium]
MSGLNESMIKYAVPELVIVPTMEIFSVMDVHTYYDEFIKGRVEIRGVVIPIIEPMGVFFDYKIKQGENEISVDGNRVILARDIEGKPNRVKADLGYIISTFRRVASEDKRDELKFYFLIYPDMPQFSHDSVASIADQSGFTSAQACINNNLVQHTILKILSEAFKKRDGGKFGVADPGDVAGIVLYAGDLWPVSGQSGRFQLTCFCRECTDFLKWKGVDVGWFKKYPSPANLALADLEEKGRPISGYQPVRDLTADLSPEAMIDRCAQVYGTLASDRIRGSQPSGTKIDEQKIMILARQLKKYLEVRAELTICALRRLAGGIRAVAGNPRDMKLIMISEAEPYLWTSGLYFTNLKDLAGDRFGPKCFKEEESQRGSEDREGHVRASMDEFWLPLHDLERPDGGRYDVRPLLAIRACYFLGSFITALAFTKRVFFTTRAGMSTSAEKRRRLEYTRNQVLSEIPENVDAVALPNKMRKDLPAVFIGMNENIMNQLIDFKLGSEDDPMEKKDE